MNIKQLACLAAVLLLHPLAKPVLAAALETGAYAPPLELTDLGGTTRKIVWGEGAPAASVVFFFDPQSPDCLLEMSFLDSVYLRARDLGLAVYAVETRGRQPAEVSRSMERYCSVYRTPTFPVLPDPAFRAGRSYGVERAPVTFITESHGVILDRVEGYDRGIAVAIARRLEQLLRRERGFLSPGLREAGVSEAEEQEAAARMAATAAANAKAQVARSLDAGDRAPDLEFTDLAGRTGRWGWSGEASQGMRIVAFLGGMSLASIEELSWLDALARRGRDAGLEVLAVEAGGMDAVVLVGALEKYRRYHPDPSFPVVPDPGGKLTRAFGPLDQLPQTYLITADGTILHHAEGFDAAKGETMAYKTERAYLMAGRPFPPPRSAGVEAAPPSLEEEAPSIRNRQRQDERYRSAVSMADAAFVAWEFDRALTYYLQALESQPKDLHALERAAQIYERRGEADRAIVYWERVLAVRPDHAEAAGRVRELRTPR
jgi:peroxiredoxin/tetratricopeptide (TPR) repeat protein